MSDLVFVTSFRQLALAQPMRGDFRLLKGIHITNDLAIKKRFLTKEFAQYAGLLEASHLQAAPNLVYGEFRESDLSGAPPDRFMTAILLWVGGLFDNAWLVKDHAMRCEAAFLAHRTARGGPVWTSNFLATRPTFADGTSERTVTMSVQELGIWADTNVRVESYLFEASSPRLRFMMEKGYARSGRAMRFVRAARGAPDLAFKIAHYCSAFESLLTTESTELSHKLSERAAFFLGARGHDRLQVFRIMKKAYTVRSKLVHGDTLPPRQIDELPGLALDLDGYLRTMLNAIFESDELRKVFDSHSDAVEEYFAQLIFGHRE